jgi:hypothetical protein
MRHYVSDVGEYNIMTLDLLGPSLEVSFSTPHNAGRGVLQLRSPLSPLLL